MRLSEIGTRGVVVVGRQATIIEIAHLMAVRDVGTVLVLDNKKPVGILCDRDIVLRVLHVGLDPHLTYAQDVMTAPLITAADTDHPREAARLMRQHHIRRLPLLGEDARLVGMVSLNDLVHHLGRAASDLADALAPQAQSPHWGKTAG